jgi:molybdopterin-guanine dinucleotide biosynthesis protein A
MIACPEMILIGAGGRNVGKTEFACKLIAAHIAKGTEVVGAKITVIRDEKGGCPRGGDGCGVCGSLHEPFCITQETDHVGCKDTMRMLHAGAARVFWLRVHSEYLEQGIGELLKKIGHGIPVVCESNSARTQIEPRFFIVIRDMNGTPLKSSCAKVLDNADYTVFFNGNGWDISPEEFLFEGGSWQRRIPATGVILAGGKSSRMGCDKSLLPIHGMPMIAHITNQLVTLFAEVIINTNASDKYSFLSFRKVSDEFRGRGPIAGIYSSLKSASNDAIFVIGCDIPFLSVQFITHMYSLSTSVDAVIPVTTQGEKKMYEPLFAFYKKSAIPAFERVIAEGNNRIIAILPFLTSAHPEFGEEIWYKNINTPEEYQAYQAWRF